MDGLIAGEAGGGGGPGVSDEAATGHAFEFRAESKVCVPWPLKEKQKDEIHRSFTLFKMTDFKHKELSTSVLNRSELLAGEEAGAGVDAALGMTSLPRPMRTCCSP